MEVTQTSSSRSHPVALASEGALASNGPIVILHQFARDLAAPSDLNDILQKALLAATQITGAQHATVLLLDEQGQQIRYRVALHNGNLAALELVAKPIMHKGLAGWVARTRSTAIVQDTEQDQRWLHAPGLGDLRSALVTPLLYANQVLGILTLGSETPGHYLREHIYWIEIIGAHTAAAIKLTHATAPAALAFAAMPPRAQAVVALAAELRGLSAAATQLTPAVCFDDVLGAYSDTAGMVIGRNNGVAVQSSGDMLLAIFEPAGGETAAARAALELQSTVKELCEDWRVRLGLHIRGPNIGIACGQALLGRAETQRSQRRAVGPAIGQAIHLSELARSNEIVVAEPIGSALASERSMKLFALPPLRLGTLAQQKLYQLRPRHCAHPE